MFYTLVSRSIITKINTPRDYFYIFLIGSVGYVILHWYLHMDKREGIVEKVREYLYYAMVFDAITAYVLMMMYPVKSDKKIQDDNEETEDLSNEETHTPEQKKAIMQKMQEARRLQQLRQKQLTEQNSPNNVQDRSNDHPAPQNNQISQEPKYLVKKLGETVQDEHKDQGDTGKRSIFTKSDESRESHETESDDQDDEKCEVTPTAKPTSNTNVKSVFTKSKSDLKVKGKKKESEIQDTEIQVYEGQEPDKESEKRKDKSKTKKADK